METITSQVPVQEQEIFIWVTDGNGMKHKVCNMDNIKICPRKGHIVVEAISKSKRHETNVNFTNVKDPNTGIIYGIVQGVDHRTKELTFQRIRIGDIENYDLTNTQDAQLWAVVRMFQGLEGSPLQAGKPKFKVQDKEFEADKIIAKTKDRDRASSIAQQLKGNQLADMCRNLGIPPEHSSINLMLASILESANNNPKQFLDIWDNSNRAILTTIKRAQAVGLLKFDTMKGYLWRNGLPLGSNEAQVIAYLSKDLQLLATIDHESKELDKLYQKDDSTTQEPPTAKELLEKELAEVRKLKEELTSALSRAKEKTVVNVAEKNTAQVSQKEK